MRDVIIVGGGLAGLTCATLLSRQGYDVALFEKQRYPFHRVCGEYISNEALPFLTRLGVDWRALEPEPIRRFQLTTLSGRSFSAPLPLGGFGLSRYRLDAHLASVARAAGAQVLEEVEVSKIMSDGLGFTVESKLGSQRARLVIGCHGKRSALDRHLGRDCFKRRSDYVAVKRHWRGEFPAHLVSLHLIAGGYCGASRVEEGRVNVCYLTTGRNLREAGGLESFERRVLGSNPVLSGYLRNLEPAMRCPVTVSQLDFGRRRAVESDVLMSGDAAGLVHPLCGNGMALALRTARSGAQLAAAFLSRQITQTELVRRYTRTWAHIYSVRRRFAAMMQLLFETPLGSELACGTARLLPKLSSRLLSFSHGQPF